MKRSKKAALYDPYLDTLGGGERHVLSILQVLEEAGYEVTVFWDTDLTSEIVQKLNLHFKNLNFQPNIFRHENIIDRTKHLAELDIFIYITDGSYIFSPAKKTYVYAMIPQKSLYHMTPVNRLKTFHSIFFVNSNFVKQTLHKWSINSQVLYPYIDKSLIATKDNNPNKDKIILSVGRFFNHLHSKRQDIAIKTFKNLKQKFEEFNDFRLILAGGLKREDISYYNVLKNLAADDESIQFYPNIGYEELLNIYKKSMYYWHLGGYGIDDQIHPEQVEHLGIAPLEAMASGCITFCYKAGGPKELIVDNETGFLFHNDNELLNKMRFISKHQELIPDIQSKAQKFVKTNFSYEAFKQNTEQLLMAK